MNSDPDLYSKLRDLSYNALLELSTEEGIHASGRSESYGCIFGRDSAITILKILKVHEQYAVPDLLSVARRALLTLTELQGKKTNIESGEEPGKFIHEFRPNNYEKLTTLSKPWYVYPDGVLRNYDSLDSTPLALIAIYRYYQQTQDNEFLLKVLPSVERGLNWIISYGDRDRDDLLEYELPSERTHGGLVVQSWTDSHESIRQKDGSFPLYPIAPVEVQGYAWLALKLWGYYYADLTNMEHTQEFGQKLLSRAAHMKDTFNKLFIFKDRQYHFPSQALDGLKNQIRTITGNPLLLLWATHDKEGKQESILHEDIIEELVERSFESDLFDADAGIRTMSVNSPTYNPNQDSYHNGSFWPKLNGMAHEGLANWGFEKHASKLRDASIKPLVHFQTPIELYIKTLDGKYMEYKNSSGQVSCRVQAWTAAAALDLLTL